MSARRYFNPFYPLLVVAGVVFCVTACGYGVMTVRKLRNPYEENPPAFIQWMDENGFQAMMIQLAVLAVMCFAAMGTDSFWSRRSKSNSADKSSLAADSAVRSNAAMSPAASQEFTSAESTSEESTSGGSTSNHG